MLLEKETIDKFGYSIKNLSISSSKRVCLRCDYCNKEYDTIYKNRNNSYKKLPKDACSNCKYLKNKEKNGNPFSKPEIQEKIKQTNLEKYGTEWQTQSDNFKEKTKRTCIEKYGVEYASQSENFQKRVLNSKINKGIVTVVEGKSLKEVAESKGYSYSHFIWLKNTYGIERALEYTGKYTNIEKIVSDILDKNKIVYNKEKYVKNYRADFIIDNIVIECDGLYWHSDIHLSRSYHKNKRNHYIENGYFPLFFREDEILNKPHIIESIIKNKLGMSERVYARKTNIVQVDKKEAKQFLQDNHLMGPGSGTSYGLYYNNQLLLLLQIKKIKDGHEISRLCSKNGFNIVGGFSKLLKHINLDKIKTFVDLRYGSGDHLLDLGFKEVSNNLSFHWTDGNVRFHRMKFPGDSGYDLGLVKIWDCGQKCFVKE